MPKPQECLTFETHGAYHATPPRDAPSVFPAVKPTSIHEMNNDVAIPSDNALASGPAEVRGRCRITAILSLVLAAVIATVYWPALRHIPHSDQSNFVLDTIDCDGFFEMFGHTYSFARTRVFLRGDTQLFRPVLFICLSAQQAFLGLHWEWCQACSIALHIATSILLLVLLEKIFQRARLSDRMSFWAAARSPYSYLPFAITVFFALNYAIVEQVIWSHIQGYLLALVLILAAALLLVRATDLTRKSRSTGLLAGAWALTLVAAFTYELGQFFALCASLFLIATNGAPWPVRLRAGLAFLAIVGIYQGANQLDRCQHADTYQDDAPLSALVEKACGIDTLKNATRYVLYTTVQPFLPGRIFAHSHGKVCLDEQILTASPDAPPFVAFAFSYDGGQPETHVWSHSHKVGPSLVLGWGVFSLGAGLTLLGVLRLPRRSLALAGLFLGTGLAQACMIVLGRLNMRPGPSTLAYNSHYTYLGLLFSLLVAAIAMAHAQGLQSRLGRQMATGAAALLVVGLLALGAGSAVKVHQLNAQMAEGFRPSWSWIRSLRKFVEAHEHEPDFRFAVAWNPRELMPQYRQIPVPYLFYRRYIDRDLPKYVLSYENRKFVGTPVAEWREQHTEGDSHLCANFVRLGRMYQVFSRDGLYYAIRNRSIGRFLACPDPAEEIAFPRDTDLRCLLRWIASETK
jgi:hypothetical protein